MKKIITASLIALFAGMTATAQDRKVAVFDPAGKVDEYIKEIVREEISTIVVNAGGYTVLERQLINKVLEENRFQAGGLVDDSQISAIGKRMGANLVFVSSITKMNSTSSTGITNIARANSSFSYYISCKMIDVQTARVEKQKTAQTARGQDDLIAVVQKMVKEMLASAAQQTSKPAETPKPAGKPAPAKNRLVADGRTVYMNGRELTKNEVRHLMAGTDALRSYNKGISRNKKGNAWIITGSCLLVSGVVLANIGASSEPSDPAYYYSGNMSSENDWMISVGTVCALAGSASIIIGIPVKLTSKSPVRKAVDMYNSSGGSRTNAELKFGFTQNGVGLALNF